MLEALGRNTFNAIDVETANESYSSICQIGIVRVEEGKIADRWETLVNPEDSFRSWNIRIHGIRSEHVKSSPTFPEIFPRLRERLTGSILVSHSGFDQTSLNQSAQRYGLRPLEARWLDSAMVVRRAWPGKFGRRGWGLANVMDTFGMEFNHHDALSDAEATALIVLRACCESGVDADGWLEKLEEPIAIARKPLASSNQSSVNQMGPLYGTSVVFTGSMSRRHGELHAIAESAGCAPRGNVSRKTTFLVVGTRNPMYAKIHKKSTKHRKAERLIEQGVKIDIMSESMFMDLVGADF